MSSPIERPLYKGKEKKLIVAVDVGTTFSSMSCSIMQPGEVPWFNEMLRWPKQAMANAKVQSIVFYDQQGKARAFGAETEDDEVVNQAEAEGWYKATWWNLHLRPQHPPIIKDVHLPILLPGVTVDKICADYLRYFKECLQKYITTQYGEGAALWSALSPSMELVLTFPNGWGISQLWQQRMRTAAQQSGFVAGQQSAKRVHFVSEAEATITYALESGCGGERLKIDAEIILCDCGGGTIDVANYRITSLYPLRLELEETAAAGCYMAGEVYVTEACRVWLTDHLRGTEWGSDKAIERAIKDFEGNAKRKFASIESASWIELGKFKNIPELGIIRGKLKIPGSTFASFFKRSLKSIKGGLYYAYQASDFHATKVILVGSLAGSPYVYKELQDWGAETGISVSRPDGPTSKAVANGALAWYLNKSVSARVNK